MATEERDPEAEETLRRERAVARMKLGVGVACLLLGIVYTHQSSQLSIGEMAAPGPGMYPLLVGVGLIVVSVVAIVEPLLQRRRNLELGARTGAVPAEDEAPEPLDPAGRARLWGFAAALLAYVVGLRLVGFLPATIPFVIGAGWMLQRQRPGPRARATLVVVSVVLAFGLDYLFITLFGVRLPRALLF